MDKPRSSRKRGVGPRDSLRSPRKALQDPETDIPRRQGGDIQFNFARTGFNPYSGERLSGLFQHNDPGNYVGSATALTSPFSRGSSHISSSDPKAHSTIDPRYLSHPLGLWIMADALLFAQSSPKRARWLISSKTILMERAGRCSLPSRSRPSSIEPEQWTL